MLGCHDFCGYYDWTFHYMRRNFGQQAVRDLWAEAVGTDAQRHYLEAGCKEGLAGLLKVWEQTGGDEHCDWTFSLDKNRNVLRLDMRECPSKGFLTENDLNADEDYCDHCTGWIIPMLEQIGMQVVRHEHNHRGQCWWEMSAKGQPRESLDTDNDIRRDPRWGRGYIERWKDGRKGPLLPQISSSADPCELLVAWFARTDHLVVCGPGPSAEVEASDRLADAAVLVTDVTYVTRNGFAGDPLGVLIGDQPSDLTATAKRFHSTAPGKRPLLMHVYLPTAEPINFASIDLPRPVPILPQLIRHGFYNHQSHQPYPTTEVFLAILAISLGKRVDIKGFDLYPHPNGKIDASDDGAANPSHLPMLHDRECDLNHLRRALAKATKPIGLLPYLRELLNLSP